MLFALSLPSRCAVDSPLGMDALVGIVHLQHGGWLRARQLLRGRGTTKSAITSSETISCDTHVRAVLSTASVKWTRVGKKHRFHCASASNTIVTT